MFILKNLFFLTQGTINLKASTEGYETPCIYIKHISALNNLPKGKVLIRRTVNYNKTNKIANNHPDSYLQYQQ